MNKNCRSYANCSCLNFFFDFHSLSQRCYLYKFEILSKLNSKLFWNFFWFSRFVGLWLGALKHDVALSGRSNSRRPSAACSCASLPTLLLASLLTSLSTPASVVFQNVAAAAATNAARFVVLIFKNISLKYISMYVEKIRRYINIYLLRCVPGCQYICLCVCVFIYLNLCAAHNCGRRI